MKRLKMVLYGEPGVGKSVFASKAPKPFFITTDGNYEWLLDFGAKEEDHVRVNSWEEAKTVFSSGFEGYETVVVDLTEDLFKWCEYEFCDTNNITHMSDLGYGKAYDITRNEFFINICKLINLDKNVIFIMHGITFSVKDRRGVEHTRFGPTNRISDKVLDMIEGRVRYFLRCYLKAQEQKDGTILKKRYLSLIPKENEFGIARGIDETKVPQDIELDFDIFAKIIGLYDDKKEFKQNFVKIDEPVKTIEEKKEEVKTEQIEEPVRRRRKRNVQDVTEETAENLENTLIEAGEVIQANTDSIITAVHISKSDDTSTSSTLSGVKAIPVNDVKTEEPTEEKKEEVKETLETPSINDIKAKIQARLLALKQNKGE